MQALCKQKKGPGHMSLVDMQEPQPAPDQVQIAVQAAGICGTDIHIMHDTFPYAPPVVLGHEFSGRISGLGSDVRGLEVGDRVISEPTAVLCGKCPFCQRGQTNQCPARKAYGIHLNGGFAQYVVARQEAVHRLPQNVDYITGAMTEPLAVCVHALIERARIWAGQVVMIAGPGPIGLLAAMVAKAHGATVIVTGVARDAARLELASKIGADMTVMVDQDDIMAAIGPLCEVQGGVDVTVEASGAAPAVETAFKCTRKGGVIVQLGLFEGPITIDFAQISFREISVIGSFAHTWSSFNRALDLMANRTVDIEPLVSGILALDQWEEGFNRAERGDGVKMLLCPPGSDVTGLGNESRTGVPS